MSYILFSNQVDLHVGNVRTVSLWPQRGSGCIDTNCATEVPLNLQQVSVSPCPGHAAPLPAACSFLRAHPELGSMLLKLPVGVSYPASHIATAFRVFTLLVNLLTQYQDIIFMFKSIIL